MNLLQPVIAIAAVAATMTGVAGCGAETGQGRTPGTVTNTAQPGSTPPQPSTSKLSTSKPSTSGAGDSTAADKLDEENLIRERLYYDVTGHSFMGDKPGKGKLLGPCTGNKTFADSVPPGATILSYTLAGKGGRKVVDQVAQVGSADKARTAADRIVKLVHKCAAIPGGDFGYGDPVTVESNAKRKIVYLPAYDSDQAAGGYIVIQTGNRICVVEVNDNIPVKKVAHLAKETATITAS